MRLFSNILQEEAKIFTNKFWKYLLHRCGSIEDKMSILSNGMT